MQAVISRIGEGGQRTSDHEHLKEAKSESLFSKKTRPAADFPDRKDGYALILLTAAVATMFWRVLFTSHMLFYRDILNQSYPLARLIHEICRKGFLPYWNPYLNFGQPILENPNSLFFYPTTLLIVLLPADIAYKLHFVLHFMLAAAGMYWLARRWRQSHLAALFATLFFVFSGPVLSLGSFYNEVACAAWIPWALLLTDYATERSSIRQWLLLTLIFLMQFLAGEPFTLLATFGLCFAYALYRAGFFRQPVQRVNLRVLIVFACSGALMTALAAVQLVPATVLLRDSLRGAIGFPFSQNTYWSFHPLQLISTVIAGFPDPMFNSSSLWTPVLNFDNKPYFPSLFLGFVPLFLAYIGLTMGSDRRRCFAGWAAMALMLLAFGRFTPLYKLVLFALPILKLVRFPIKLLIPVVLLACLLAGWGIDAMRVAEASPFKKARNIYAFLVIATAGVWLLWAVSWIVPQWLEQAASWALRRTIEAIGIAPAGAFGTEAVQAAARYFVNMLRWELAGVAGLSLGAVLWFAGLRMGDRRARIALPAALLVGTVQLVLTNYSANPTVPAGFYTYRPPVLDHFKTSSMPYRYADVFGRSPLAAVPEEALAQPPDFHSEAVARNLEGPAASAFQERMLLEHGGMLDHAEGISNVDPDWSFPVELYQFWVFALHKMADPSRTLCLMGRSNVRYNIIGGYRDYPAIRPIAAVDDGTPFPSYLYENGCFLPRAYVAGSAEYSPNPDRTFERLSDPAFEAHKTVLLESREGLSLSSASSRSPAGIVESFRREPNSVTLRVSLSRPGYVVLLDRFDPNWHATIDGHETEILRANHMFRAVRAAGGEHMIRFFYRQRGMVAGVAISLSALVLAVVLYLLDFQISTIEFVQAGDAEVDAHQAGQEGGRAELPSGLLRERQ